MPPACSPRPSQRQAAPAPPPAPSSRRTPVDTVLSMPVVRAMRLFCAARLASTRSGIVSGRLREAGGCRWAPRNQASKQSNPSRRPQWHAKQGNGGGGGGGGRAHPFMSVNPSTNLRQYGHLRPASGCTGECVWRRANTSGRGRVLGAPVALASHLEDQALPHSGAASQAEGVGARPEANLHHFAAKTDVALLFALDQLVPALGCAAARPGGLGAPGPRHSTSAKLLDRPRGFAGALHAAGGRMDARSAPDQPPCLPPPPAGRSCGRSGH